MHSGTTTSNIYFGSRILKPDRVEGSTNNLDYTYSDRVNMVEERTRALVYSIFDRAAELADLDGDKGFKSACNLRAATTHSLRATMVAWAARSLSSDAFVEARLTGRWADTSKVFQIYWNMGKVVSQMSMSMRVDPLFSFKPWPKGGTTVEDSVSAARAALAGNSANQFCMQAPRRVRPRGEKTTREQEKDTQWVRRLASRSCEGQRGGDM